MADPGGTWCQSVRDLQLAHHSWITIASQNLPAHYACPFFKSTTVQLVPLMSTLAVSKSAAQGLCSQPKSAGLCSNQLLKSSLLSAQISVCPATFLTRKRTQIIHRSRMWKLSLKHITPVGACSHFILYFFIYCTPPHIYQQFIGCAS
jgi:hypothetical protein